MNVKSINFYLFLTVLSIWFLKSGNSMAQKFVTKDTMKLEEVVITATKTSVNRNNVPLTVSVVTEKQIIESSESALLPLLNEPVPTGGLVYHFNRSTTLKASVAKGFRSPTIRELYLWATANAGLKPERMVNYEIGILQKLIKDKLSLELTGFKADGDNLIKTVTSSGLTKYQNTG